MFVFVDPCTYAHDYFNGRVCVCVCMCVRTSIAKWSGHRPSNRKVVGLIPSCGHFSVVGVSLSKKLYSHCSSPLSCINGDLVLTREAVHPAVTSMSTW